MAIRDLQRAFSAGELTPELFGRIDLAKRQEGLALCRNFQTLPHGPAINRAGTEYVATVKDPAVATRVIPFSYTNTQTFAIELGAGYFRWKSNALNLLYADGTAFSGASSAVTLTVPPAAAVVTVSIAAPAVVTWAAHGMVANAPFSFSTTDTLPTGITAGTTYYVSATGLVAGSFQFSATAGGASITTTGTQSGIHTANPLPFACTVTWAAHGFASGAAVTFTTSGALPTGIAVNTTYYVRNPTTNTFELGATAAATSSVVSSGTQSGVQTAYLCYVHGSIVKSAGVNYYCIVDTVAAAAPPNATYWYAMPTSPNIYEIPNGYAAADLMDIHYVQSADVLTLVHPNYPPTELRRYGATNWQTAIPVFNPPANVLTGVTATASGPGGGTATSKSYVVTTVAVTGLEESVASSIASDSTDLTVAGNIVTITFTDPTPAGTNVRYYVYKLSNGLYGYIGQAGGGSFIDNNITADVTQTPPISDVNSAFNSAGNYPAAVSYFQQRRVFAGTASLPQNLWATCSGTESNMSYTIPVKSDNRIAIRIAAREASAIRHIVPAGQMLLLTATCEWKCGASSNGDVLTPTSISVAPQSYVGANNVIPVVVNNIVLYAASRGGHIRELSYSWQASGYVSGDVSLMAPHLFDYNSVVDMAYCRGPVPTLWAVSSNGSLMGMTYVPEQQVSAWHHHDTGASGVFESCCVIAENNEDMLYLVVRRTINGSTTRYIERLHTRLFATLADAFFVDCGATYSGVATKTVTGLTWLEGQTVNILGDGATFPPQTVTGGAITIDQACSKITVGIPIVAQLQTLPVAAQVDGGYGQGHQKNVNKVWLRVYRSSGILAGPDFNSLVPFKQRTIENYGSPPNLVSDEIGIVLSPSWGASGQVCIQQTDPLPLDLASMTLEVAMGG
jgi:hypothetical protein